MKDFSEERPVIRVHLLPGSDIEQWQQVWYGMEEEGIPCQMIPTAGTDVVQEAYQAAMQAALQVGMACTRTDIVVHDKHMHADAPLFRLTNPDPTDRDLLRRLGNNAARLVKGLPFKA